ncbi:MAG: glucose-1-phosphate adenylyltransferase [Candidatus Glassbacteria bacterium]
MQLKNHTDSGYMKDCLVIVLAGGHGERLYPLTKDRTKPAVPFGGAYRIIDFTLSNCVNSGLRRIFVLTQYKSYSLDTHIRQAWFFLRRRELGEFIETIPPQLRSSEKWYQGTADAIFQNVYMLNQERPKRVFILSGDHVYRMNYRRMLESHINKGADLTIASVEVPRNQLERFGTIKVDDDLRVVGFKEKSKAPHLHPKKPKKALVSMGVYLFETEALVRAVIKDAKKDSQHDFGKNIIPDMLSTKTVYAYNYIDEISGKPLYWRDIGTIDSYWEANMDLIKKTPPFDLYDSSWPIFTVNRITPPAIVKRSVNNRSSCEVVDSMISNGCIVEGAKVKRSIISSSVVVSRDSLITDSIIMAGVVIGKGARIKKTIIDKQVVIPRDFSIGYKREEDSKRFKISPGGVTVVPKGYRFQ